MSSIRLIIASLLYHWRGNLAVAAGVAAGTAVLTGALLVGDSMRGSLRSLALDRLGRVDMVLSGGRFFRAELARELAEEPQFASHFDEAAPAILLRVSLEQHGDPTTTRRANQVNLAGCGRAFWGLGPGGPARPPEGGQIVLNRPLAERLAVGVGQRVTLRLPRPDNVPAESTLGRKRQTVGGHVLTVAAIIPAEGLGRFGLRPNQQLPQNAYVSLAWLQDRLDRPGRINTILVAGREESAPPSPQSERVLQGLLRPKPADYGLRIEWTPLGYVNITSDRMILEAAAEESILRQLPADAVQPVLTYLANTISCPQHHAELLTPKIVKSSTKSSDQRERVLGSGAEAPIGRRPRRPEIPYSTVSAVDLARRTPLGPFLALDGKPIGPIANDQIVLGAWAAEQLRAAPGDTIEVAYFEPESTHGQFRELTANFRLAAICQLAGAARDPHFTPEVQGITDEMSMADWDAPFPFDAARISAADEQYWDEHRATPKAFVSLAGGRRLWAGRFGQTTSIRVRPSENVSAEGLRENLLLEPAAMGLVSQPVKRWALEASVGATSFSALFLGFSLFIIASAVMLVALLFRLGIDQRAAQTGILRAVGFNRRQVGRLLAAEGLLVALVGSLVGVPAGIGYAALMLLGLQTWWLAAVATPFLSLHWTYVSLVVGSASGLLVAYGAVLYSVWRAGRMAPRELLAGCAVKQIRGVAAGRRYAGRFAWGVLAAAIVLGLAAVRIGEELRAGVFFGVGVMVLAASLATVWDRLRWGATGPAVAAGGGNFLRMALRNAARNPTRSTLTIGLVAAASFLLVAVSAFRLDPSRRLPDLDSGDGGFALVAESDRPIYHDLNTPAGRAELGFTAQESRLLAGTTTIGFRLKPGDDASCLNLYQARQPRVLSVPQTLIDRGGFAWAAWAESTARQTPSGSLENPWRLLQEDLGRDEGGVPLVPAILEKNTATYSLHLGMGQTYDISDGRGQTVRLKIVALLAGSIFQGDLLIGQAAFLRHFPEQGGWRFFLTELDDVSPERTAAVRGTLERALGDFGFAAETTGRRLAGLLAVQNTYLSTFMSLGGLGLLLGTVGLAAVQSRNVLERRRELALLRATGFRRSMLAWLVMLETGLLLTAGLGSGMLAALVAVLPHLLTGAASIPWVSLAVNLALVPAVGLLAGLAAAGAVLRAPLLAALQGE